ncbi:CHASE2 domain-containing sensor protein [Saccharomonospora amisosensis]|uniref:CHASE2 domain-containing sensor protein n=1 Tax=Saccharomonospora amisosensis TaxID=1128677 RepID=A0A7X5UNC7_9PSEU|nr:CHASE2 domain-containing sensor protein [Saccharomonospora amisosensis]
MSAVLATGLLVATLLCIAANTFEVVAKAVSAKFVVRNSAEVGVGREWIRYLAVAEAAGVAGLVLGLLGPRLIGLAAAVGLVLYFIAAVVTHIRARVFHNIAFPVAFLLLAAAALGHFAWSAG